MTKDINHILLIDDDEPTHFLMNLMIRESGLNCEVHAVYSGIDALDWLCDDKNPIPDLIFLDINMPMMNGWEFLEKYRLLPEEKKSKMVIVMLTTSLNPNDKTKAESIDEISQFVNKPLAVPDILKIANKVTERSL